MLLKAYGKHPTLNDVEAHTKTRWFHYRGKDIGMTAPIYILNALDHFGLPSKMSYYNGIKSLKKSITQHRPAVALLRSGQTTWHYVLVIGYDETGLIIANPSSGQRETIRFENFLSSWHYKTDMDGNPVSDVGDLIRMVEVYTETLIVPFAPIGANEVQS